MKVKIEIVKNDVSKIEKASVDFLNEDAAKKTLKFHSSFKQYEETPLVELNNLSKYLGLKNIFVKDESYRFELNAFKALGGSYSIGKYIAERLGKDIDDISYDEMISQEIKDKLGDITFITATDGNHGRGIAWTCQQLRQKAVVYMPKGSALERRDNIKAHGAKCEILDMNYDECVKYAYEESKRNGYVMIQDTSWEEYEDIPRWIMQGYLTMAYEAYLKLEVRDVIPTHVFLQAGVGAMAAAVTGFLSSIYGKNKPKITIVEPNKAACIFKTAKIDDGKIHYIKDEMDTIMAGLACGEPVTIGWDILHSNCENFLSVPDELSAHGMRVFGNPLKKDERIISGESGAVTLGVVSYIMQHKELNHIKKALELDENSVVLLFSTEGDTYKKGYRDIVWNGKYENR
ncbi:MAG: diaminopropionate ammonia-lyase [Bacillota bacterium]|nr:diaminopropionate ammonia-lyase [Bacillota bacterium]